MKDPHDDQTLDALEPPKRGRGRPATGKAKTPAQRAKEYRERRKQSGDVTVTLNQDEVSRVIQALQLFRRNRTGSVESCEQIDGLIRRFGPFPPSDPSPVKGVTASRSRPPRSLGGGPGEDHGRSRTLDHTPSQ